MNEKYKKYSNRMKELIKKYSNNKKEIIIDPKKVIIREPITFKKDLPKKAKLWKNQTIIALITTILEWFIFIFNLSINGHFNYIPFILAILWTIWLSFCIIKFYENKNEKSLKQIFNDFINKKKDKEKLFKEDILRKWNEIIEDN